MMKIRYRLGFDVLAERVANLHHLYPLDQKQLVSPRVRDPVVDRTGEAYTSTVRTSLPIGTVERLLTSPLITVQCADTIHARSSHLR